MLEAADAAELTGATITGTSGERLGTITELRSADDGRPSWARVDVPFSGGREAVLPLFEARKTRQGEPWVPYTKAQLLSAPFVESLAALAAGGDRALLEHYARPAAEGDEAARLLVESVAPESVAPESVAPGSVAPESVAPGSVAPGSMAPGSMAPEVDTPTAVTPGSVSTGRGDTSGAGGAAGGRPAARHRSPRSTGRGVLVAAAFGAALVVVLVVLARRARPMAPLRGRRVPGLG